MKNLYLVLLFLSISLSISDDCLTLDDQLTGGETVEKCDKLVVTSEYKKCKNVASYLIHIKVNQVKLALQ